MDRPPLDIERVRAAAGPRWTRLDVVAETASTNADLLAAAGADTALDGVVLAAEHQTAGRGRLDRTWTSPPRAGLVFSALIRPVPPMAQWGWLPLLVGVAVADAVRRHAGLRCALKWPNDVLAPRGGKLAGILVQTAAGAAVIGVGFNVSATLAELPVDTATSLGLAGVDDVDRTELLATMLIALDDWLTRWTEAGGDPVASGLADAYREVCGTLGVRVQVDLAPSGGQGEVVTAPEPLVGRAVDVDGHGRLLIAVEDAPGGHRSEPLALAAGDVRHLRSTDARQ